MANIKRKTFIPPMPVEVNVVGVEDDELDTPEMKTYKANSKQHEATQPYNTLPPIPDVEKNENYELPERSKSDRSVYGQRKRYTAVEMPRNRNFNFSRDTKHSIGPNTAPVKSLLPVHGVKSLKVTGLQLKALPKYLFRMSDLETLHLSPERSACLEYKLQRVPKEIGNLHKLQTLVLDTNELQTIPPEISLLQNLKALTLSNNCLTELPLFFNKLQKLQSLHLSNNRFTEFPIDICDLKNLVFLDIGDNSIREVPAKIDNLSSLTTFILYLNDIEELPDNFCGLEELTTLWLGNNRLTKLPVNFGMLQHLDWELEPCSANIDGNPLTSPPSHVCREGVAAIKQYFNSNKNRP